MAYKFGTTTSAYEMDGASAPSSSSTVNFMNNLSGAFDKFNATAQANSAWSAEQAAVQREWQEQQNAKAMAFNQAEAQKNRDWQQYMSNTAHQREVADLKAAGLNPVLSAMNGNGASVGSGATASGVTSSGAKGEPDTSLNSAMVGLLSSFLNYQSQQEATRTNAAANLAIADKTTAMSELVAQINAAASRYVTDAGIQNQRWMAQNYPNNLYQAVGALAGMLGDSSPVQNIKTAVDDVSNFTKEFFGSFTGKSSKEVQESIKKASSLLEKYPLG